MSRINPTVTEKAYKIYNDLPLKDKKPWVSAAIVEKHEREKGLGIEKRIEALEQEIKQLKHRIGELERRVDK